MRHCVQFVVRSFVVLFIATSSLAATLGPTGASVPGEVLVKIEAGASADAIANLEKLADADQKQRIATLTSGTLWRLHSRSKSVEALASALQQNPNVIYAEPNYILHIVTSPNDPSYAQLWGLKNTGQSISGYPGIAGADIDAEAAWNVTTGSAAIVVGVVDTGVDYLHPDLAANIWSNPGGVGNVACGAGTHGFNAITNTCDPMDDHYHGTHVSGTIGAVGNNSVGVVGVNWTTSIMGLKFLSSQGSGTTAGAITAIEFAVQAKIDGVNVRILSNSWGGGAFSKALLDEINRANENDILFVAAAGNDGSSNDSYPHYPSNYTTPNMISVAATDNRDAMAWFSNYGLTTVHLGAPGVDVLSCYPNNSYISISGTSMATPHVAGVAALVLAQTPSLTTAQVKSAILGNTDPISSLAGKTVTGGRLNAARALGIPPGPDFTIAASPASRTIVQGNSTTYTITVTPTAGFADAVDFSVSGLPSGASGLFSPTSATTTSTLTVTTSGATPLYTYPLTITGTSGALAHATSVNLTIVSTPPVNACPSFATRTSYFTTAPTSVAIGDFNRDGNADVAFTNVSTNKISIRLGSGSGTLLSAVAYNAGNAPISVAIADFNGDAKLDLAVANSGSNDISMLLGNGDGTFQSAVSYGAGTSPFSVAPGEFNNDGKADLVVANNGSSNVSILLGQGDGTFQTAVHYGAASGPFGVAVADFDSDGHFDLAVADYHADKVSVLLGNGDGTFAGVVDYAAADSPSSVATGDFNGDGNVDLALSNYQSNNVSVLAGSGDGTFAAAVHYPVGTGPYSVSVGDFNGDGNIDLVAANGTSGTVSILMGNGTGMFQAASSYFAGTDPNQVSTGDFNGDGKVDLAVASVGSNDVSILINVGTCSLSCNTITAPVQYSVGGTPNGLASGDFNGDGKADLAAATNGTNNVSITLGNGDGTFYSGVVVSVGTNPDSATVGDFNRDGSMDLATANSGSNNASVLLGNGDGTFQSAVDYPAGNTPRSIAAADFNRDGRVDLAVANSASGNVSVLLGNGDGTFQSALDSAAGTNPYGVTPGDFNRDGKPDLAVANSGSGNVSILLGNGDGTFQPATNFNAGTNPRSIAIGDFNRDGKADLAVANNGSSNVSVLLGNGSGTFQTAVDYNAGTNPSSVTAGDFNDDGTLDLAVANNGSNNVSILVGNGGGAFAGAVDSATGSGPAAIVTADFNRDGKPDMATANSGAGSVAILLNSCPVPDLTVTKTHVGTFTQGDTGKTYTITVTNSGAAPTTSLVSATDVLPIGLVATAMSGTGWTCTVATRTCTRSDVLAGGASYPPITLTVNVASGAPANVTNAVTVSGGGELNSVNNSGSDPTAIVPTTDLIITSSHQGSFSQGATGRTYTIIARNAGGLATTGTITVSDTLPSGLTATAISGTGWTCSLGTLTCTRSDVLAGSSSYPAITLTLNVAANAPAAVTNTATVAGGGDTSTANNTASDPTVIWSGQTCGTFGLPVLYSVGSNPIGIASGNFNADGYTDIAATNYYSGTVSILLGIGNGTFQDAVHYAVGNYPDAIAAGDLNHDGQVDLVVASGNSNTVSILLGDGNGAFDTPIIHQVPNFPIAVVIEDFDHDGNSDVVTPNYYASTVSVLLGNGDGTLQASVTYAVGYSPTAVAVSDFNGDGRSDLVVTSNYNGVSILLGNGDGTFQAAIQDGSTYSTNSVTVGDFNQDGKPDLALTKYYDGISILLGNGDGSFQDQVDYYVTYGLTHLVTDDLNGDGKADLVVVSRTYGYVSTLIGNGDGTFQTPASHYLDNGPQRVAIGDFNRDGKPDLALTTSYGYGVAIMLGGCADLTITKSHDGNFVRGQGGASYTLTVTNSGVGSTGGTVSVTDVLPNGLTATYIYAYWPWNCTLATLTCTTNLSLAPGDSYPEIDIYVNVASDAPANVTNTAHVSGGGDINNTNNSASDPTSIVQIPDLTITKTHSGTWLQGQTGRTYTITVSNSGSVPTSGTVYVSDYLPPGLSGTAMTGAGWNCNLATYSCTRSDILAANSSYPPITLTVSVSSYAPANVTNYATVAGGGDNSSDTASDLTAILTTPTYLIAAALSTSQVDLSWNYSAYAAYYEVFRSFNNGPFVSIGTATSNYYFDLAVSPTKTYLYKVRAVNGALISEFSNADLATTFLFTDDPIVTGMTKLKALHITELRTAVNAVRAAAGLAPTTFTDTPLNAGSSIKAIHWTQLRTSLDQARTALGLFPVGYPDTISLGSIIKADHVRDLRTRVK